MMVGGGVSVVSVSFYERNSGSSCPRRAELVTFPYYSERTIQIAAHFEPVIAKNITMCPKWCQKGTKAKLYQNYIKLKNPCTNW